MAYTFFPSATTSGGGPFHFFQYEVTVGIISVDGFESRFALACQPKGTCKEEIHRLFTAKHINPRTFSDCTDLDSTMYYRLQNEAEQPKLSTIVSLCVGFSLDTLTGYHLIALAGYTLLPRNTLHRIYAYFIENSQSLTISECNKFLEDMGFHKQGVADGLFCREIDGLFCRSSPDIIVRRRCVLSHKRRGWLQPSPSFRYSRNLALQDELYHPVINNGPAVLVCVDKRLGTGPVNQSRDAG